MTDFKTAAEIEANTPITAGETLARAFRIQNHQSVTGKRDSLEKCVKMLDAYAPELFPANEQGQVDFARAIMETVADEITAFLNGNRAGEDDAGSDDPARKPTCGACHDKGMVVVASGELEPCRACGGSRLAFLEAELGAT